MSHDSATTATTWAVDSTLTTTFDFDYEGGRDQLLRLYDKGTRKQWIGSDRLDWSLEVDPDRPIGNARPVDPDLRYAAVGQAE